MCIIVIIIRKCPFSHSERCFNNNDVCLIQSCVDCSGPMYIPRDVLHPWRERNHSWLELSQVHRETTNGVRVTVMPFFMGHREQQQGARVFFWRYNVRIESLEEVRVQLKERQWRVYSEAGTLETVNGKGVIGQVRRIDSARSSSGLQVLIIIALWYHNFLFTAADIHSDSPRLPVQQSCVAAVPHRTHVVRPIFIVVMSICEYSLATIY